MNSSVKHSRANLGLVKYAGRDPVWRIPAEETTQEVLSLLFFIASWKPDS